MPTSTPAAYDLVGAWNAQVTFIAGPRQGETESVVLTLLPDGVIVHSDEVPLDDGRVPRGIGEWTAADGRLAYRFDVVLADTAGRPATVAHVHANGSVAPGGQTFTASGGSEIYGLGGNLLATHQAEVRARRAAGA